MKILIIGSVGTGKTTLAKKISKEKHINYWEIDSIVHDDYNNGRKRVEEEQKQIIEQIDREGDWIIEGVLRKNLYYLLEIADKIIYLDVPRYKRNIRILVRFFKQKMKIESVNYKPTLKMLGLMFQWSNKFEKDKSEFEITLKKYEEKLKIMKK